jgi:hypothetical protein
VLFHLGCFSYLNLLQAIPNKSNYNHTLVENIILTYMFNSNLEFILPNVKWVSCGLIDVPCLASSKPELYRIIKAMSAGDPTLSKILQ